MAATRRRTSGHHGAGGSEPPPRGRTYGLDERIVMPETRVEVVGGRISFVAPAEPPHASRHSKVAALLEAHVAEGYDATVDMLTRTSEDNDFAPDASVYATALDPLTGERQLEELAFEVVSTQTLSAAGRKAAELCRRGVRRVFAIDVERRRALEWLPRTASWQILPGTSRIEDRVLVAPLPIVALVDAAKADDAVATALLAKRNPVLLQALAESQQAGKLEGKLDAILAVLTSRGLAVTKAEEQEIRSATDAAIVDDWLTRAALVKDAAALLRATPRRPPRKRH
ncbi:MAG TPA: Uma2 family endonuclease [Polyangiaceae bacterium]